MDTTKVRLFHISLNHIPVTTVAYQVDTNGKVKFAVASKHASDKWDRNKGNYLALAHFTTPAQCAEIQSKNGSLTEVKQDILRHLSQKSACSTTREAAKWGLNDMTGVQLKKELSRFLIGSRIKVQKKVTLLKAFIAELDKKDQDDRRKYQQRQKNKTKPATKK